jgi:tRNA(Met) C34 N-acetyltransferase TmcA
VGLLRLMRFAVLPDLASEGIGRTLLERPLVVVKVFSAPL